MHSALISSVRGYAACHVTTAHQRLPNLVPLVLQVRSTQTTTHLVDIIQTVSRYLLKAYDFALYGLYLHPFILLTSFDIDIRSFHLRGKNVNDKSNLKFSLP